MGHAVHDAPAGQPRAASTVRHARGARASEGLKLDRPAVIRFVTGVVAVGTPLLTIPIVVGAPAEPFLLLLVYGVYLGGGIRTARRSGPGGVRRLFRGVLRWRIGWPIWVVVVGALPLATIAMAILSGTFSPPADGWLSTIGNYLFLTFVFGALIINVVEETAWQGLVQRSLTERHGPLRAALLTAVPFAAVHVPLSFAGDATVEEGIGATILVLLVAPVMRYLMGRTDTASGGSLLAVGVMHASFNASHQLGVTDGDWQAIAGLVIVAGLALVADRSRGARAARRR